LSRRLRIDYDAAGEQMAPGIDWEGFRGMGNLLRHAYHRIDDKIVWDTIKDELPVMREAVTKALRPPDQAASPACRARTLIKQYRDAWLRRGIFLLRLLRPLDVVLWF
jgi:Protein of unknown function DUF86